MDTVLSGIRPTGHLHLGNYYGAVKSFVRMQHEYNCYFFIADWHSLTTNPKPEDIRQSVKTILAEYLACGLEPDKATIYIQSDIRETLEFYLYFNMNTYLGELERVTTFKEKARKQPNNVNAGLLTYPTLMAADILQHRAKWVPVGKDQEQNMEMARKCARRFNNIYGVEFFPEPQNFYFNDKAYAPADKQKVVDAAIAILRKDKQFLWVVDNNKIEESTVPEPIKSRLVNGIFPGRSGDITVVTRPQVFGAEVSPTYRGTQHGQPMAYDVHIPFILYGWNVEHGESTKLLNITDIAPTICAMLHIQMPDAAIGTPAR